MSGNKSNFRQFELLPATAINTPPIGGEYIIAGRVAFVFCRHSELVDVMMKAKEQNLNVDGMVVVDRGYNLRVRELQGALK